MGPAAPAPGPKVPTGRAARAGSKAPAGRSALGARWGPSGHGASHVCPRRVLSASACPADHTARSEPWGGSPDTARTGLPGGDQPAWLISLGRAESLRLTAYGVVLLFLGVGVFSAVTDVDTSTATSLGLLVAFVATMVVHEFVHALCFLLLGGSPRFGAGVVVFLPYLSTTSPGDRFDARRMSVIGLAPLVSLSVVTLAVAAVWPSLAPYVLVAFLANLSGSVGDIWLVTLVWRFARLEDVTFEDRETGVAVWTDDDVAPIVDRLGPSRSAVGGFVVHVAGATVVIALVTLVIGGLASVILPAEQVFRLGPAALPLFEKQPSGQGLLVSINLAAPLVAGLLFASLGLVLRRVRGVRGDPGRSGTTSKDS